MILRYTDRSKDDVDLAFKWYEIQRTGLGFDFLDCVEMSLCNILSFPKMYVICYSNFRRCVIRRFPYSIFYTIEDEEIVIHSVFDNRQDPEKRP
ncbi:MAG: type II toxin-antitoxin system RelE/ParE family toxin [Candidatus Anammoxibacter sp.]